MMMIDDVCETYDGGISSCGMLFFSAHVCELSEPQRRECAVTGSDWKCTHTRI